MSSNSTSGHKSRDPRSHSPNLSFATRPVCHNPVAVLGNPSTISYAVPIVMPSTSSTTPVSATTSIRPLPATLYSISTATPHLSCLWSLNPAYSVVTECSHLSSASGYHIQYGRPGERYGQNPPPAPPPSAPTVSRHSSEAPRASLSSMTSPLRELGCVTKLAEDCIYDVVA